MDKNTFNNLSSKERRFLQIGGSNDVGISVIHQRDLTILLRGEP
jgi:hypothetical protein